MKLKNNTILIIILLLTLAFRLYFTFSTQSFSSDESYYHSRLINHIIENKLPMFYDKLSYGGHEIFYFYPQLFHVLLALFSFIPLYLKIIPALMASSIVVIIYLIAKKITNDNTSSLLTAFLAAFIPIEIRDSVNQISIYSFVIPIILILYLCLMNLENKKYFNLFLILSFLLPFIHASSFLFIFSLIFYLILSNTESLFISKYKKETIIFSFFLILLINFLLYRNLFLQYGFNIIWQNIPDSLFNVYFKNLNILEGIYLISALPIILGSLGIFFGLFREKNDSIILLTAAILATSLLLSLRILNIQTGVLFLGIFLILISSLTISKIYAYLSLTKFSYLKKYVTLFIVLLIIILSVIPSYLEASSLKNYDSQIKSFQWIKDNIEEDATILVPLELGNTLTAIAERKNIIDSNFLLSRNAEERFEDVNVVYSGISKIKALEALRKYNSKYIFIDKYVKDKYNITKLRYLDEKCFEEIKNDVYKVIC
ncbi:MAG: hypothetical protein AABW45_00875 [Nanoarchaeota archaeon]